MLTGCRPAMAGMPAERGSYLSITAVDPPIAFEEMSMSTPARRGTAGRVARWLLAAGVTLAYGATPVLAATCLTDRPPNDQPANSQAVPNEFCLAGAAGQHYYLWQIPESAAGKRWTVKLESLPGENTILMVQSLDKDPH